MRTNVWWISSRSSYLMYDDESPKVTKQCPKCWLQPTLTSCCHAVKRRKFILVKFRVDLKNLWDQESITCTFYFCFIPYGSLSWYPDEFQKYFMQKGKGRKNIDVRNKTLETHQTFQTKMFNIIVEKKERFFMWPGHFLSWTRPVLE